MTQSIGTVQHTASAHLDKVPDEEEKAPSLNLSYTQGSSRPANVIWLKIRSESVKIESPTENEKRGLRIDKIFEKNAQGKWQIAEPNATFKERSHKSIVTLLGRVKDTSEVNKATIYKGDTERYIRFDVMKKCGEVFQNLHSESRLNDKGKTSKGYSESDCLEQMSLLKEIFPRSEIENSYMERVLWLKQAVSFEGVTDKKYMALRKLQQLQKQNLVKFFKYNAPEFYKSAETLIKEALEGTKKSLDALEDALELFKKRSSFLQENEKLLEGIKALLTITRAPISDALLDECKEQMSNFEGKYPDFYKEYKSEIWGWLSEGEFPEDALFSEENKSALRELKAPFLENDLLRKIISVKETFPNYREIIDDVQLRRAIHSDCRITEWLMELTGSAEPIGLSPKDKHYKFMSCLLQMRDDHFEKVKDFEQNLV